MKKILITALILSMTSVLFIACGKNTGSANNGTDSSIVENDENIEKNDEEIKENEDDAEEKEDDSVEEAPVEADDVEEEENVNLTKEQVESLAADLCSNYYSYEVDTNISEEHNGVIYYYVEVNVGPPDELIKKFMIGSDGHLYKYDDIQNGVFEAVR